MIDFHFRIITEHLDRHDGRETTAGAVGAGRVLAAVSRAYRVLEQALLVNLVDVRSEVVEGQVIDDGLIGGDGFFHALVPDIHPHLVAV